MSSVKLKILTLVFILICISSSAQTDSSISKLNRSKINWQLKKLNLPKMALPKVSLPKWKIPKISLPKIKKSYVQFDSLKQFFPNSSSNTIFFSSGINFSKQNTSGFDYTIPFNYDLKNIQNDVYKPGYFVGARWERSFKNKHLYNIEIGLQRISSGTNYKTAVSLDPFIGDFVQHKADNQFFILNIGTNYKKLINSKNNEKHKFYALIGPTFDIRLSKQSLNNKVTNSYNKILLRANLGLEFDNNGYYTIFMHYKPSITSFTKQPITTSLNSFEFGMMLNANDIF